MAKIQKEVSFSLTLSNREAVALLHALTFVLRESSDSASVSPYSREALKFSSKMTQVLQDAGVPKELPEIEHSYGLVAALEGPQTRPASPAPSSPVRETEEDAEEVSSEVPSRPAPTRRSAALPPSQQGRGPKPERRSSVQPGQNMISRRPAQVRSPRGPAGAEFNQMDLNSAQEDSDPATQEMLADLFMAEFPKGGE